MIHITLISTIFLHSSSVAIDNTIIDGYTNRMSAFAGDSIELYLNAPWNKDAQPVRLFNLEGKVVAQYTMHVFPQQRSQEIPYQNGFGYKLTKRVAVPSLQSGIYLWENKVPFVIKCNNPKIIVLYSSNTENAYNSSGGKSLYGFNSSDNTASVIVSFLRPQWLPKHSEAFLRWMLKQDFQDVGYITDVDMDDYNAIRKSKVLIIAGHSEYWTLAARRNYDRYIKDGRNALVLSGNTMWWQVRYSENKDQLICYRKAELDPIKNSKLKTINWNEPSLNYPILPSLGVEFTRAGYGRKEDRGWNGYKILRSCPLLENTNLSKNDILFFASDELDGAPIVGIADGVPLLDYQLLGFVQAELIAYDLVSRAGVEGVATWIVCKPSKSSGVIINTASTDWCSDRGIGNNPHIQTITHTMITKLVNRTNVFSTEAQKYIVPAENF